jgi:RNA polymerase sigma-70 factor (ECF subfamily)
MAHRGPIPIGGGEHVLRAVEPSGDAGFSAAEAGSFDYAGMLRRCAAGDRAALRRIYERDAPIMLGMAVRILRRRDLAEEAVQDAFVQVWHKAASFDSRRSNGRAWLFAIVRNRALSILRDGSREELGHDESVFDRIDDAPGPDAVVASLAETGRLRRCLEQLDERRRHALVLVYTRGLTHGELAASMSVPLGTAKAIVRRALLALRECME